MNKMVKGSRLYLTADVTPGGAQSDQKLTAGVLRYVARRMAPFYRAIARSQRLADRFSQAVVETDLDRMQKLMVRASPRIGGIFPGTNGIGYFITFPIPKDGGLYANGTTIPPGTVQFLFEPKAHRALAAAVYPLYQTLANNRCFAQAFARAVRRGDLEAVVYMVRSRVKSRYLRSVTLDETGFALNFRFPFSKYPYRNLFFRDDT